MQPTMKLRRVQRGYVQMYDDYGYEIKPFYVYQQWWEQPPLTPLGIPQPTGQWIDVPIEVE